MNIIKVSVLLLVCASWASATNSSWWKHATFYQIYPRSFADSDADGNGDLRGIAEKAGYFKELGVDAVWLSPICSSPLKDGGYDISDYYSVNSLFGSMEDFIYLRDQLHNNGVRLILDFVPNHTSEKHTWFIRSAKKDKYYDDFYIWKEGDKSTPPNNWLSIFINKELAWTYHDVRKAWYLRQFGSFQPDLNYNSEKVQAEISRVMKYWLDLRVDGFRIDAVPYIFEDPDFPNEPLLESSTCTDKQNYSCYDHKFSKDQKKTFEQIYSWRSLVDKYAEDNNVDTKVLMTEAYTTPENTFRFYGSANKSGAHFSFNFNLIQYVNSASKAKDFVKAITDWLNNIPEGYTSNWVLGNHDNHRVATRLGSVLKADALNMLTAVLPGVMVTYMGEELGMEDVEVPWSQAVDLCQPTEALYKIFCRDFERTPFPWNNNTTNCGFGEAKKTWLPAGDCSINYGSQNGQNGSHVEIYKQLLKIRKELVLQEGSTEVKVVDDAVFTVNRSLNLDVAILVLNTGDAKDIKLGDSSAKKYQVLLATKNSKYKAGHEIDLSNSTVSLAAHDGLLLLHSEPPKSSATQFLFSVFLLLGCFINLLVR